MEKDRILDESDTLGALQTITAAYIHPLLSFLAAHGLQLPEAGFELCDEKNEIIATAELCWPDKKTAFLRNDGYRGRTSENKLHGDYSFDRNM